MAGLTIGARERRHPSITAITDETRKSGTSTRVIIIVCDSPASSAWVAGAEPL